jgi:hypothetical protein
MVAACWSLTWCGIFQAQVPSSTKIEVVVRNAVAYVNDGIPYGEYATAQTQTPPATGGRNFRSWTLIGDVAAVNGKPAKGVAVHRADIVSLRTAPANGQAISDVNGPLAVADYNVEIRQADGTPVGTVMLQGFLFGPPPPGAPSASMASNLAIVGGTGAFLGARGYSGHTGTTAVGLASIAEDPGIRRTRPGDEWRLTMNLIPAFAPEIVITPDGPAVVHSSDFTPVSSSRPARRGETLSVFARRLGPTRPGVEPGQSFAASPLQTVNSPIEILVNESPAEVLAATGYPNSVDGYQVNFRVPDEAVSGPARLRLSAAWIPAPEVQIAIE